MAGQREKRATGRVVLTRWVCRAVTGLVASAFMVMGVAGFSPASAAAGEVCDWVADPETGQLVWVCEDDGTDPGEDGTPGDGGETPGSSICRHQGKEIACTGPEGSVWNGSCYVGAPLAVQPAAGPNGEKIPSEGQVHVCYLPPGQEGPGQVWVVAGTPVVDPVQVAHKAIASMDLDPIGIGIVPESGPNRMGLVGLPVWMWVDNPHTANAWGPITESATDGPVTVTATATVAEVVWNMGDGSEPITCGAGTPYADSYGKQDSPTCGYRYQLMSDDQSKGVYRVTAGSRWVIEWSGGGMDGTIELTTTTNPMPIRIGEAQVLTQ